MHNFKYLKPESLTEALEALSEHGWDAKVMAGGQSLILLMREGLIQPEVVISLQKLSDLVGISVDEDAGVVHIGGLTTHRQVELSADIKERFPLLTAAYRNLGNIQVRNFGTLGGNLCHNAPGSDPPPPLITLDAKVQLTGLEGKRELSVEDFGTDYYETALAEDELLTGVTVPVVPPQTGTAYKKYAIRPMDMAIVGASACVTLDGGGQTCEEVRIALGGVAPTTIRAKSAESIMRGQTLSDELIADAAEAANDDIDPLSDVHASEAYRRQLTPVAIRRVVTEAWQNAQNA